MNSPVMPLPEAERARLEQFLVEFDQDWTPHHLGLVAGQLQTESPEFRSAALTELVKIDLDYRQQHEPTRVEWYLERFPELGESSATLGELMQAEIAIRQAAGDAPSVAELQQRFPKLHDQIVSLLANVAKQDEVSAIRRARRLQPDAEMSDSTTSIATAAQETLPPKPRLPRDQEGNDEDAPVEFGRYRLLRELGRGAMGTVYLAEDTELRRHVALKRPRIAGTDEASLLERFYREAHAAATLDHPNICPVYDIGQHDGIPYITMAYVEGKTLSRVIRDSRSLNPRAIAVLLRKIAVALAEAHAKGVIHRDLKPGNIMLNHRSDPIVMDFGLARQVEDVKERLTVDGTLIGTPGYMSPEQVDGDLHKVGPSSDIYSLGVVLFELLTGRLPFQGSVAAVIGKIVRDEPPSPSSLRAGVPQQLEEICLKMMAKSPADRYATMGDVAEVLGSFIKASGEGAVTTAPPPIETLTPSQLAAQQKQLAQMIASGDWREASVQLQRMSELSEPLAAPYAKWAREQTAALHVRWQDEQRAAGLALANAKEQFKHQDYAGATQTLLAVNKQLLNAEAQQVLEQSLKLQEEVDLLIHLIEQGLNGGSQAGMFRNMQRLLQLKPKDLLVRDLYRKFRWQQRLGWFGATLADAFSFAVPGRTRATLEEPMLRKWFAMAALVGLISFGLMSWAVIIYLRGDKQTVKVEVDDAWLKEQGGQLSLAVDGKEHTLTGPGLEVKVTLGEHGFSVKQGDTVVHNPQTFSIEKEGRQVLHIDSNGLSLASRTTLAIDQSGPTSVGTRMPEPAPSIELVAEELLAFETPAERIHKGLAFGPSGKTLYVCFGNKNGAESDEHLWEMNIGDDVVIPHPLTKAGHDISLSDDSKAMAIAKSVGLIEIMNTESWAPIRRLECSDKSGQFTDVKISPDGRWVAGATYANFVDIWELTTGKLLREFKIDGSVRWSTAIEFAPDSQQLVVVSEGAESRIIHTVELATNEVFIHELQNTNGPKDFTLCGNDIAVFSTWGPPTVVSTTSWKILRTFGEARHGRATTCSPNKQILATRNGRSDGVSLFDCKTFQHVADLPAEGIEILRLCFSSDSRLLAAIGTTQKTDEEQQLVGVRVWRLTEVGKIPATVSDPVTLEADQSIPAARDDSGWTDLFNGRDLAKWEVMESFPDPQQPNLFTTHRPSSGGWEVRGGVLLCKTDKPGLLRTRKEYGDFQLKLDFKMPASGNSGIYIRTPASGHPSQVGMEVQLVDEDRPGQKPPIRPENGTIQYGPPATRKAARATGNWNSLGIECAGDMITIKINDVVVNKADMGMDSDLKDRPRRGHIGLSNWRGLANGCEFRNIRIRE